MTDLVTAIAALEEMAKACGRLADELRRVSTGETALEDPALQLAAIAYTTAAAAAGSLFLRWTQDVRIQLERRASASEN